MDGHALERHRDVAADECPAFGQGLEVAVDVEGFVRQFAAALAGIAEKGADAALDIDPGIALGGAGGGRQGVEIIFPRHQILGHGLEHPGPLVEGELPHGGPAHPATVFEHRLEIEPVGPHLGHRIAGDSVNEGGGLAGAGDPLSRGV